ncbi:MAG: hypothetical protein GY856_03145 [bacterium]|nr:hypothetical protein [bacterium]
MTELFRKCNPGGNGGNGWEPPVWSPAARKAGKEAADAWEKFFKDRDPDGFGDLEEMARIRTVRDLCDERLLKKENVVGVATSLKVTDGKPTGTWSLTIFVKDKKLFDVLEGDLIVEGVEGVPTDVVEVGEIGTLEDNAPKPPKLTARVRPVLPGYSIGNRSGLTGTLGCLVRDLRRPSAVPCEDPACEHLLLSNHHVLVPNGAKKGDPIVQPGRHEILSSGDDNVAKLERWVPIEFNTPTPKYHLVDAAVARPISGSEVTASIMGSLIPRGVDQAFFGDRVTKVGRTTGMTSGRVIAVDGTVKVKFANQKKEVLFRHQIVTTIMAEYGDSGSLLMDRNFGAVGLLFAGSPCISVYNHIADVETALGVRPVTAPRLC